VQVGPLKPTLKEPGSKRLKLKCDELLSSFAFNFNLRRYNLVVAHVVLLRAGVVPIEGLLLPEPRAGAYTRSLFSST